VKIIFPDANNPETFYLNLHNIDSVWFLFIPTHPEDNEVVYLMSVVFFNKNCSFYNNTIRIEPRYYNDKIFSEFLKNTQLNKLYNLLIKLIEHTTTYSETKSQLNNLQQKKLLYCEIKTPTNIDTPLDINDYSKCVLFSYEPRTLVDVQESVIEDLISRMQKILPPDYTLTST